MESSQTFKIKVEKDINDATCNDEYEEFTVAFQDCNQGQQSPTLSNGATTGGQQAQTNTPNASDASTAGAKKLTTHMTKVLAKHFVANGSSSKSYKDALKKYGKNRVDAYLKTVNRILKEAPEYVYQECESLCFVNISEWLKVFKERNVRENCFFEPAIVMNAIVNNEKHQPPANVDGVDLKAVYTFLSNALLGLPQKPLDSVSAKFLNTEFESLINDANTDFADSQTLTMKEKLEQLLPQKAGLPPPSLDPLFLLEDTVLHHDIKKPKRESNTTRI